MISSKGSAVRSFSRFPLVRTPTPLTEHPAIGALLGRNIRFFIKRDDLGEIGGGGNKLRKLEFALGAASDNAADTLVTFGALQSNHARLTAAVAARAGMRCELILSKRVPRHDAAYESSGNLLLMRLFGAGMHVLPEHEDPLAYSAGLVSKLRAEGRRPHIIPFGGSDVLGAMGYAHCAMEITEQLRAMDMAPDHVVVASGSGGTQAGLVAGFCATRTPTTVRGVSVLYPAMKLDGIVKALALETCAAMRLEEPVQPMVTDDRCLGEGYGMPNENTLDAIRTLAVKEGVILDPVYTGKAFAGLLAAAAEGQFTPGQCVVFVHTGGLPGLFAYPGEFQQAEITGEAVGVT